MSNAILAFGAGFRLKGGTNGGSSAEGPARRPSRGVGLPTIAPNTSTGPMKHGTCETRRRLLGLLGTIPVSFWSLSSRAQPKQLDLTSYFHGETPAVEGAELFAQKATEDSAGTIRVSLEVILPWVSLPMISEASALAHYCAPEFEDVEPLLGLSALPMLTGTFDEAETLLRIAKPYYCSALARHDQILLATQPWRPVGLWSTFRIQSVADLKGSLFPVSSYVGEQAGWGRTLVRLGAQRASFSEAEFSFSSGYTINMKFTQEYAFFTEIFLAAQLNFLTVSRKVFESLGKAERHLLVATGRDIELCEWKNQRALALREHREIGARGVSVAEHAPADVLAALRRAAEPDIQSWTESAGEAAAIILTDYRRAVCR